MGVVWVQYECGSSSVVSYSFLSSIIFYCAILYVDYIIGSCTKMIGLHYISCSSIIGIIVILISEKAAIETIRKSDNPDDNNYIYKTLWYEQQVILIFSK